jgi:F-type H+-transporting ATPase subunit delta
MSASIPYRYARALLELARAEDQLTQVGEELTHLDAIVSDDHNLKGFLSNTVVPKEDRLKVLDQIFEKIAGTALVQRFARLLLAKERFGLMSEVLAAYQSLCDEERGLVKAYVSSAKFLDAGESQKIQTLLEKKTGKKVLLKLSQDTSLIGGVMIRIGSRVYDASVRGNLRRFKEGILKGV